jgi:hypothetical protein
MFQVRGDPVPRVQWYRDGLELNDPRFVTHFDGSHFCQLAIEELQDGDSGRYMCEATNRVGRVSTFARLFVVSDPKILEADHKLKRLGNIVMPVCLFCFVCLFVCYLCQWSQNCTPVKKKQCESTFASKARPVSERILLGEDSHASRKSNIQLTGHQCHYKDSGKPKYSGHSPSYCHFVRNRNQA